uniref:LOX12 n=1 Tax=Arundo donax TaxID=35708 RepID=A0A0A8YCS9_ARUDO
METLLGTHFPVIPFSLPPTLPTSGNSSV